MVHAQTRESDREAALRRIAIVLSSLPAPIASQLLGSVDPNSKGLLRRTMSSLADVDPLERQRALLAFKGSVQRQPILNKKPLGARPSDSYKSSAQSESYVTTARNEHSASQLRDEPGSRVVQATPTAELHPQSTPLSFLADVDDDTLVGLLRDEHPQAVAMVLSSIAPTQAARVLPNLDAVLQSDALARIGRLGDVPDDVVIEIADHLRSRIKQQQQASKNEGGKQALDAILAAMPKSTANQSQAPSSTSTHNREPSRSNTSSRPLSDPASVDPSERLRIVADSWSDETPANNANADPESRENTDSQTRDASPQPSEPHNAMIESTDAIHQHLIHLTPEDLCLALGKVSTRQAMLALCGLPYETTEASMAVLPRAHAKQVRRSIASLQSLQLREIDEAKEAVAKASIGDPRSTPASDPVTTDRLVRMAA